jgi:drug/metabolite transporter (DMT)-like permease
MLAYSAGAIYYTRTNWNGLDIITVNGWQTLLGGFFLLPVLFITFKHTRNNFDFHFWSGTLWLAIPVSIGAVQCWMRTIERQRSQASYVVISLPGIWFYYSRHILNEPLSLYTAAVLAWC